jgi:hypothetical protein
VQDESQKRLRLDQMVPDALKKAIAAGVGAVFMTEESIRHLVSEMKLPKEALASLVAQTDKTRKDMFLAVSKEVKRYLRSKDLEKLLSQILEHFTIEVKAEIKFKTNDKGGVKLDLSSLSVSPKENKESEENDDE